MLNCGRKDDIKCREDAYGKKATARLYPRLAYHARYDLDWVGFVSGGLSTRMSNALSVVLGTLTLRPPSPLE